ncbi:MAG: hypothetical protein JWN12_790 [Candidatus Saccharibacteria bacterium]|nr:hypothetical protein [Candidatus Saccharibacteria bacterium]
MFGISSRTGALVGMTTLLSGTADDGTGVTSTGCHTDAVDGGEVGVARCGLKTDHIEVTNPATAITANTAPRALRRLDTTVVTVPLGAEDHEQSDDRHDRSRHATDAPR